MSFGCVVTLLVFSLNQLEPRQFGVLVICGYVKSAVVSLPLLFHDLPQSYRSTSGQTADISVH